MNMEYTPTVMPLVLLASTTAANYTNVTTDINNVLDLPMDSNFVWLLCSLIFAISWVMYITYYNSRVAGYIITRIVNRLFIRDGFFKIGSFTVNVLSGKIMFRDVVYITHDYSVRVQDGYLIFRWWRSYVPKDVSEDLSHSDTRLSVVLNGFELHVYNRSTLYAQLEKTFGLEPSMFPDGWDTTAPDGNNDAAMNDENTERQNNGTTGTESVTNSSTGRSRQRSEAAMARTWRDLIPVIKMDVSSGRVVFGNRLVPTSLSITVEESHFVYSTKPAASSMDKLMHFSKCWAENARVMLAPSPKYTGMLDEPPRYMGEGFVLMSTNYVELYMYMDEPGVVPAEPVLNRLANGDIVESSPPMWGVDIKCGKGTDFSYGPWADRQREHLFKFFFPNDYQPMKITKTPKPGDKRQMQTFDIRLSMLSEATIDVLFSKNKETNAVHINVGAGSYLEITLPWITLQDGCTTKINGQLLHLEATTSLQYRDLVSSETLEFSVSCHYPLIWNHHQQWELSLTGCKATVQLVYAHKNFFADLINDWSSKHRPDLMHFIPYTWRFGLTLKHSELLTCSNLYNWMDCSSVGQKQRLENAQLALCAHLFHLSFDLPFDQFLPDTVPLTFSIQGESIDLSLFVPEVHTTRNIILALEKYAKVLSKEGSLRQKTENIPKWRSVCTKHAGWVDFWWVPIGAISIQWVYHPAPPLGPQPQADISTPVKEELLLSPMRFPHCKKRTHRSPDGSRKFDPTSLPPDKVTVELEIGPSVLLLYGTALRNFLHLKENIFGDDQMFTDMYTRVSDGGGSGGGDDSSVLPVEMQDDFDMRYYRPLEVDVSVIMHDIQAHLLKNCTENDPPCPVILVERFGFEMRKRYDQTELQLLLSPSVLLVSDNMTRGPGDAQLNQGRLTLSSLQIRGHAMFSDHDRALDEDTIEYAWLVEIQLGKLSGKLTTPQLHQLTTSLELLVLLMADSENELCSPHSPVPQNGGCDIITATQAPNSTTVRQSISANIGQPNSTLQALLQTKQSLTGGKQNQSDSAHGRLSSSGNNPIHVHKQNEKNVTGMTGVGGPTNRVAPKQSDLLPNGKQMDSGKTGSATGGGSTVKVSAKSAETQTDVNIVPHKLKYKFCRVMVDAIDLWLVESGTALQFWVSPVRVANCNLHGKQVGSGLSCVIYNTMLRQLVCQNNYKQHKGVPELDTWLEVGSVTLGTLVIESVMSLATPEQHIPMVQNRFLKIHDDKTKRLWFLWSDLNKGAGKCGCVGGCAFFGSNRNGPKFFKPSQTDLQDGLNIAAFRMNDPGKDLGYGQSILHEGQLVFRTPPYTAQEICLQETAASRNTKSRVHEHDHKDRIHRISDETGPASASPPVSVGTERRVNRRFSYTLTRNGIKDVPYARLVDPPATSLLPAKLDSDSKLHTDRGKSILNVPDIEPGPKNSVSDSKLAVDYFHTVLPTGGGGGIQLGSIGGSTGTATTTVSHNGTKSDTCSPQPITRGTVNISSESHHSLSTRLGSEERLRQEVQRTISMSSENQSEAFFSADEELNPSRTSSLRHSIIGSGSVLNQQQDASAAQRKKFASDLSIVTDRTAAVAGGVPVVEHTAGGSGPNSLTECVRTRLSSHRSDHEIHTPEHRSFSGHRTGVGELLDDDRRTVQGLVTPRRKVSNCTQRSLSPRLPETSDDTGLLQDLSELQSVTCDSSDTRSLSSNSYVSAVCSQEDMTLVDLHMQVNRQIIDSPMLMSSYISHLSQIRCANWNQCSLPVEYDAFSVPMFHRTDDGKLLYIGGRFVPHMDTLTEGFTLLKMVPRPTGTPEAPAGRPTTSPLTYNSVWDGPGTDVPLQCDGGDEEELLLAGRTESGSRTAVIVKLQGDMDITVTPLLLECLQRFVDALTPTLYSQHPLNVVAHLHASCVSQVEAANTLKKDQDVASRIGGSTVVRTASMTRTAPTLTAGGTYEEYVHTQVQMAVVLPKVNITLLQASVVEEIISFSALDNIRDFTCVSLFTVCFDNVTARFHRGRQAREVVQIFHRPAVMQSGGKKGAAGSSSSNSGVVGSGGGGGATSSGGVVKGPKAFLMSHPTVTHADIIDGEPVYIETSEKQQEETVVSLNIGKVHAQLRRLRNECSILNDAVITAIPVQHSKVLFTCTKMSSRMRGLEYYMIPAPPIAGSNDLGAEDFNTEDKLGFIMFECGLEGVCVKVVKRSQFEKIENSQEENATATTTGGGKISETTEIYGTDSVRSREDIDSVDRQSEASTQTTVTSQRINRESLASANNNTTTSTEPPPPSSSTQKDTASAVVCSAAKDSGNISSCVIDLKTVWFNFAAPPRAPITRKLDYTRLDWNLLSTASPAINAWMNPSNRFAIRIVHMFRTMYRRSTGVVACLMAEALDVQAIHMPAKSKYAKLTPLAKTLQEDPSCQLCAVLEKYMLQSDMSVIEASLRETDLPQLSTLRQGVIVLSRQWKNVLYTPLLLEHNYKMRYVRPLNVTFAVPELEEEMCLTDGEASGNEEPDVTDECAMLLRTDALLKPAQTQHKQTGSKTAPGGEPVVPVNSPKGPVNVDTPLAPVPHVTVVSEGIESVLTSPSPPSVPHRRHNKKGLQPTQNPSSSRASVVFPILSTTNPFANRRQHDDNISYGTLREDRAGHSTGHQAGSDPSVCSQSSPELPASPPYQGTRGGQTPGTGQTPGGGGSLPACTSTTAVKTASCEDLYSWMAKQQEYVRGGSRRETEMLQREVAVGPESKVNTLATDSSGEAPAGYAGVSLYPMHDSLRLLDAHLIFQPLLSSLGVMPQQMVGAAAQGASSQSANPAAAAAAAASTNVSSLDSLGSNLSLVGSMDQMRIDIVVSEHGKGDRRKGSSSTNNNSGSTTTKTGTSPHQTLHLDISCADESPAFICERVSIELEVEKMADMTVDDMIRTRNVLYISRGQLKKHTSTALNFSIGVRYISQQVNMPLLRLLHQISNMYQNVKDTQNELREQRPDLCRTNLSTATNIIAATAAAAALADTSSLQQQPRISKNNNSSSASDLQDITIVESISKPLTLKVSDPSSILSQNKPVISPSASVRSRPQSFAQKLRSTGKSVKGYMNLSEGVGTPMFTGSPSVSGGLTVGSDKSTGAPGNCWKTVYHLLDLYATMPETKTITHRFSMAADISEHYKGTRKYDILAEAKSIEDVELPNSSTPLPPKELGVVAGERTRLVVFGVARIHRTRLLATLSGLKLEAEITSLHSSLTWRKKSKPASLEFSLTGQVGRTMIVLLEGVAPNQQTVVKVTVGKSQALYSSVSKRTKDKNSGLLTVGAVNIDIPQHPVALHGMVTRGSKQLSSTLQELRVTRTASRLSRTGTAAPPPPDIDDIVTQHSPHHHQPGGGAAGAGPGGYSTGITGSSAGVYLKDSVASSFTRPPGASVGDAGGAPLLQPLVMQFSVILQSLSITAALLPSLQAQYKMDQVNSTGVTGSKAKFTVDLPQHSLSFTTKLQATEANLPSEASISLPAVHVSAEYVPEGGASSSATPLTVRTDPPFRSHHHTQQQQQQQQQNKQQKPPPPPPAASTTEGVVLKKGGYLAAHADIGVFEHSLTTDLLNHLVFVQKVFMKEVNEVVQKVYGGEKPVRLWMEDTEDPASGTAAAATGSSISSAWSRVLFSLVIRIQRIQLTATTAGSSAVRLETGAVALELSNRVQNVSGPPRHGEGNTAVRLFGKAQVDVNLCLGQLTRNPMFEEAEPDFQQFAFFNTRIGLRNAFQDEMVEGENKEVVLITLKRPLVYVQPLAVDKAILVWLNYKNAYDYWNEKRANLNKEVLTATQQVFEKVPFGQLTSQLSAPNLGTLFLQLTVDDMGICLPLNPLPLTSWGGTRGAYDESRGAVVVTLESTSIAACSSGSLVSKGRFANLCLRFADDFDPSLDDWKPDMNDSNIMNLCVVSEGTYEVCSRTIAAKQPDVNAKWFLNVQWQMEGVDINLDVNVGKQLSALGHTLTMLTGAEDGPARSVEEDSDDQERADGSRASQESILLRGCRKWTDTLPAFVFDPSLDAKKRSKLIEKEMNEQAKIINDLRSLGASHGTIEQEMRRLHELEAMVFKDFRRDMIQKLRRQSVKASSIKGKLGLGSKASAYRSKSFIIPSPTPERHHHHHHLEMIESPEDGHGNTSATSASYESSPRSGPSRTASLRVRNITGPRVTFSDTQTSGAGVYRQCSLPSASSDLSLPEAQLDWADHMDIDGEKVELRRKIPTASCESVDGHSPLLDSTSFDNRSQISSTGNHQQQQQQFTPAPLPQKPQEPNIDFELDVKVLINSGKCVLHTKDPVKEEELKMNRMRKDRSCSAGLLEFPPTTGSPDATRRNKDKTGTASSSAGRYRSAQQAHPNQLIDLTIFHIPGMDVKLHYESKIVQEDETTGDRGGGNNNTSGERESDQQHLIDDETELLAPGTGTGDIHHHHHHHGGGDTSETEGTSDDMNVTAHTPDSSRSSNLGISNPNYMSSPASSVPSDLDAAVHMEEQRDVLGAQLAGSPRATGMVSPWKLNRAFSYDKPTTTTTTSSERTGSSSYMQARKPGVKKASLFAWMTLQSIPEETIISPHILEFLEQTLEPIPSKTNFSSTGQSTVFNADTDLSGYGTYVYTSFPVDVIVYFHMQPSTFRFSCLPVSRVECMLQLPSLDIVFSSKRAEEETFSEFGDGKPTPATAVGGLSVTGCLADFSVYIFHPYGGGKKSGLKEAQWSPLADSERKDSLSINVEFVKFHLSRSRKLNFQQESDVTGKLSDQSRAVIRFSTIIDIGSASFKYDMRRLTEILAFPKAWYRRSIVRRLFLGDLSSFGAAYSDDGDDTIPEEEPVSTRMSYDRHHDTAAAAASMLSKSAPTTDKSPMLTREKLRLSLESNMSRHTRLRDLGKAFSSDSALTDDTPSPSELKGTTAWETLVLFAVNFTKLNVHMNMGNVMGNVTWQTKDFRSEGRLSIGSTGHKNMYISLGLGGSSLDAKGGIVGGTIEIAHIDTYVHIREEPNTEPDHTVGLKLHALELRLDYMGTSVLMCRVSALDVTLRDEWRLNKTQPPPTPGHGHCSHEDAAFMPPTRRPATIFVHGVLCWDQLQLMISKSSTADLIKMYHKLEEFFSQQFNSSKRVFSRLGPTRPVPRTHTRISAMNTGGGNSGVSSTAATTVILPAPALSAAAAADARHHRHWQRALCQVAGLQLSTVHWPLPHTGTVLGGTIELRGQNISLACFHGINFKSKSWALFSLKEPCISFNTEAQEIPSVSSAGQDVHVVQTLTCSLGLSTYKTHHSMATVCKVSRNVIFPPQFKTLQEWFHYAFASSHIDEVDRFPSLERERPDNSTTTNSIERARSTQSKLQDPNHTREIIFALPSLQLHLKTEHLQTAGTPDGTSDKPTVECSFITEFEDHIFVTVDAEAFFFLHDLITSYVKEKERVFVATTSARANSPDPEKLRAAAAAAAGGSEEERKKKASTTAAAAAFSPEDLFTKDWRNYQCKTWHLEPTVRLLSWAGKSIEPYGIDYILQKLGFSHARTTIPKWMQRGFMDPLDKVLAVLTLKMVSVIREDKNGTRQTKK